MILERDMHVTSSTYPVTIVSRRALAKHNRIRFSWFLVGTAFGILSSFAFNNVLSSAHPEQESPVALKESQQTPEPAATPKTATAHVPAPPKPVLPTTFTLTVENGDTLISLLTDTGLPYIEAHNAVEALRQVYNPRSIGIGQKLAVDLDPDSVQVGQVKLSKLSMPISITSHVEVHRENTGEFAAKKIESPTHSVVKRAAGTITSSLYETGLQAGVPAPLIEEIIKAYSYDVDFQRDIREGDSLEVMFEGKETEDGAYAGSGNVLFASLKRGKETFTIYRYANGDDAQYYNDKGETVRKALLKTPINGARISSGFGMRRHPILGYSRMHRGLDFAAPRGTPIYAAGDGVVDYAARRGGYGNYVKIKHNGKYSTAYGHVQNFAKGIKKGSKVKQGQIIAYVGTTGRSTGPHLHYEILVNNQQVNPAKMKFKTGDVLTGKRLASFKVHKAKIQHQLAALRPEGAEMAKVDTK